MAKRDALVLALLLALSACGGDELVGVPPAADPPIQQPPTSPPPALPPADADVGPWPLDLARGEAQFAEKCQRCHGTNGAGGYGPALNSTVTCAPCAAFHTLWPRIDEFMPLRNPEACDAACSRDIAAWIINGFSTAPSCSVEFTLDRVAAPAFHATARLFNYRGLDVSRWRLAFTLPADHQLRSAGDAKMTISGQQVLLESGSDQAIADGQILQIPLQGTHPGQALLPADVRLDAPPCFMTPPA